MFNPEFTRETLIIKPANHEFLKAVTPENLIQYEIVGAEKRHFSWHFKADGTLKYAYRKKQEAHLGDILVHENDAHLISMLVQRNNLWLLRDKPDELKHYLQREIEVRTYRLYLAASSSASTE